MIFRGFVLKTESPKWCSAVGVTCAEVKVSVEDVFRPTLESSVCHAGEKKACKTLNLKLHM